MTKLVDSGKADQQQQQNQSHLQAQQCSSTTMTNNTSTTTQITLTSTTSSTLTESNDDSTIELINASVASTANGSLLTSQPAEKVGMKNFELLKMLGTGGKLA